MKCAHQRPKRCHQSSSVFSKWWRERMNWKNSFGFRGGAPADGWGIFCWWWWCTLLPDLLNWIVPNFIFERGRSCLARRGVGHSADDTGAWNGMNISSLGVHMKQAGIMEYVVLRDGHTCEYIPRYKFLHSPTYMRTYLSIVHLNIFLKYVHRYWNIYIYTNIYAYMCVRIVCLGQVLIVIVHWEISRRQPWHQFPLFCCVSIVLVDVWYHMAMGQY